MILCEQIGDAWLYCGDMREVLPRIAAVDHVISDPPYEAHMHRAKAGARGIKVYAGNAKNIRNDGHDNPPPLDFESIDGLRDIATAEMVRVSHGWVIVFCTPEGVAPWRDAIEATGAKYKRACFWDKIDGAPQFNGQGPAMPGENFVIAWAGSGHSRWNGGGKRGIYRHPVNTDRYGDGRGGKGHPTEKPLSLMLELVSDFSDVGQTVLDPFMGSGTTGVACLKSGRKFIGIEKDRKYFDIAVRRMREAYDQPDLLAENALFIKAQQPDMGFPRAKRPKVTQSGGGGNFACHSGAGAMTWLISKALFESLPCSPGPEVDSLAACYLAGVQSVQLSETDTPPPLWLRDKMIKASRLSQFGMTLKLSTGGLGAALLTLFRAAFPVRTSAPPEPERALTGSNPASGGSSNGLLARYDRTASSWKTAQCSLLGDSELFSETWPQWGTMRNGACWARTTPSGIRAIRALITSAAACGFLLPAGEAGMSGGIQRVPTPRASANEDRQTKPTPSQLAGKHGWSLGVVARMMTPNSRDWKDTGGSQGNRKSPNLGTQVGGHLNPTWVEWLMGWPIGWTALEPLATDSFRSWLRWQRAGLAGLFPEAPDE